AAQCQMWHTRASVKPLPRIASPDRLRTSCEHGIDERHRRDVLVLAAVMHDQRGCDEHAVTAIYTDLAVALIHGSGVVTNVRRRLTAEVAEGALLPPSREVDGFASQLAELLDQRRR